MNKAQLIDAVRDRCDDLSRKEINEVVDAFINTIEETVADGTDVNLTGFGRFTHIERAARTGRNPQTGESIRIAASRQPSFKPGKAFKDSLN
jgi:DNA-binding protein HU-beta